MNENAMKTPSEAPTVQARRISRQQVEIDCPYCERQHVHGAAVAGHRLAHCADPAQRGTGYVIADIPPWSGD